MGWDELILTEDEYLSSVRPSAREWCLMYSRGVPVKVIARWCRVGRQRVQRAIDQRMLEDPVWWGQCWVVHDRPVPGPARLRRPGRNQVWWGHYTAYAAHVSAHGRGPSQLGGADECRLYKWVHAQRRAHQADRLAPEKVKALDRVGEWSGTPRGNLVELWEMRLRGVEEFRTVNGRFPTYRPQDRSEEKTLAIWLGRQRTWSRKNTLDPVRQETLNTVLSGWDARR